MDQRVSLVTLGVRDRARARAFYEALGWKTNAAPAVVGAIVDAARTGHESGDGIVWTTPVFNVTHNRTGMPLEEVEVA